MIVGVPLRLASTPPDDGWGQEYVIAGQSLTFEAWLAALARVSGREAPRLFLPDWVLRAARPGADALAPLFGLPPAVVREGLAMSQGVHWAFRPTRRAASSAGVRAR